MAKLPTLETVVQNLRQWRNRATPENVAEGTGWYPANRALIEAMAFKYNVPSDFAAGVVAAYSQNSTWKANLTMAARYLRDRLAFGLVSVQLEVCDMEAGSYPADCIGSLKRPAFFRNLIGDLEAVTCDRWHIEAAIGRRVPLTPEVLDLVTEATRVVAAENGEAPATTQAIIWCAIRGTGK